jgi:hypothetical protein
MEREGERGRERERSSFTVDDIVLILKLSVSTG